MRVAMKLNGPRQMLCALCESEVDPTYTFVKYDNDGELVAVAFTDGRKKVLHRCGVEFPLPPRPTT